MGSVEKAILDQCYKHRMPIPDKIQNAPQLLDGLDLYYTGFMDLTTCREIGMVEGPISWTNMAGYCKFHNITGEQAEDFLYFVSRMDSTYLKHCAAKVNKK